MITTVYPTRYAAQKDRRGDEKVVKVDGGFVLMTFDEYRVWKNQK